MRWCRLGGMEGRRLSTNQTARFCQLDQWRGCEGASGTITLYCAIDMLVLPNIQGSFYWPWSVKKGFRPSSFIKTNAKAANSCSMLSKLLQAFDSWQELPMVSKAIKTCEAVEPAAWTAGKLWLQYDFTFNEWLLQWKNIKFTSTESFGTFVLVGTFRPRYFYWHSVEWLKLKLGKNSVNWCLVKKWQAKI